MNDTNNTITFIGNAIVDILCQISDQVLKDFKIIKGAMQLVDEDTIENLLAVIKTPTVISGGSAANTAVGFSSFGGRANFIGQIGNDKYGEIFSRDINMSGVFFEKNIKKIIAKTSKSLILVTPDAERSMNTFLGASLNFNIDSINEVAISKSRYIYIEGYLFDQEKAKEAIYYCCELAKKNNCKIALSLSDKFCVDRHRSDINDLIQKYIDILFANENEIMSLSQDSLEKSINKVLKKVEIGAITLGSKGSVVFEKQKKFHIEPIRISNPIDTTGAGDLFASGFLFGLINFKSIKFCGDLGSKAAAEIITHYGARPQISLKKLLN